MRKFNLLITFVLVVALTVSCSKDEDVPSVEDTLNIENPENSDLFKQGNGAPNGQHYNLNIIGVSKEKTADMTGNNGHRIFVPLVGNSKINLIEGDDFAVLDANGTDKDGASFQLPNPDPDGDGTTSYSIWMRALGTPGGSATITTCADADLTDGYYEVCSAESLDITRTKGKPRFENISRTLLTILVENDIYEDDVLIIEAGRYTIFDEELENYFWKYDNNGLKLLQLRFYPIPTDIL